MLLYFGFLIGWNFQQIQLLLHAILILRNYVFFLQKVNLYVIEINKKKSFYFQNLWRTEKQRRYLYVNTYLCYVLLVLSSYSHNHWNVCKLWIIPVSSLTNRYPDGWYLTLVKPLVRNILFDRCLIIASCNVEQLFNLFLRKYLQEIDEIQWNLS
jgi:hypothetical protein